MVPCCLLIILVTFCHALLSHCWHLPVCTLHKTILYYTSPASWFWIWVVIFAILNGVCMCCYVAEGGEFCVLCTQAQRDSVPLVQYQKNMYGLFSGSIKHKKKRTSGVIIAMFLFLMPIIYFRQLCPSHVFTFLSFYFSSWVKSVLYSWLVNHCCCWTKIFVFEINPVFVHMCVWELSFHITNYMCVCALLHARHIRI